MARQSARSVAHAALREWQRGDRFADAILQARLGTSSLAPSDRGFATELFYGVLRNLTLLDFWIDQLRSGSLDADSRDLLRLGFYQVFLLQTPSHAAVYETVELANRRSRPLINAVMRSALRKKSELRRAADAASLATRSSHPAFLVDRWTRAFGEAATTALCDWDNQPAPVYARVNRLRATLEEFLAAVPDAEPLPDPDDFVRLNTIPMDALRRGACYIQDPSTTAAVALLDPQPEETVLDACAAPGGKTALIAQLMNDSGLLVACDRDASRVARLRDNLDRLGVTCARTACHDWAASIQPAQLPQASFDRILVDAPCTNTGVLRRRIDARWRLGPRDLTRMPEEQWTILRHVVPLLKPGGTLVYSTCSLEAEENAQMVSRAQEEWPFLQLRDVTSVLPFPDGFDGAFAAKLVHAV